MNLSRICKSFKLDYLMLLLIMVLAFYMALIPHQNYPYPVHIDEWVHLANSKALLEAGSTTYTDPFLGEGMVTIMTPSGFWANRGAGFYIFLGTFHQITGISWLAIFKYFPAFIFVITVLSVYILAKRHGFGWEAAFFTGLMPTTVGILGPGFLVPVALGLPFIPLSLFLVFHSTTKWSYLLLFLMAGFLLYMHATTAIGMAIVLIPYILLNLKGNFKRSLIILLAITLPFLALPWTFKMLLPVAESLLTPTALLPFVEIPRIIVTYGYLPIFTCLLGVFVLAIRNGKENYALVLGLLALLLMLAAFFVFHIGIAQVYYRGLLYMMLMMSIIAGAGLMWVRNLRLPDRFAASLKMPLITKNIGNILCLAIIAVTLVMSIPQRLDTPYYRMIDDLDYNAFVWIKENVDDSHNKAILDPWKATAFAAIAEKHVYTRIHTAPTDTDKEAYRFLQDGCTDTTFLRENGISIVYARRECQNPDLVEVNPNIYLLKETEEK